MFSFMFTNYGNCRNSNYSYHYSNSNYSNILTPKVDLISFTTQNFEIPNPLQN